MILRVKIKLLLLSSLLCLLPGCLIEWSDIDSALTGAWDSISCWMLKGLSVVVQALVDFGTTTINALSSVLPTVDIPQPQLDSTFLSNIAFFVPISEMATIIVIVFSAVIVSYAIIVLFRWLKITK